MLLVAVSGGIDSMCLAEKVRLDGEPFAIAHCNFGLRGSDSDSDEGFVREWASGAGVTCHVKRFDTSAYAAAEGISIEMAARRLRYHWFGELCREHGYSAVAVAHNANDNAETLILNLLRGTGLKGLLGMKASGFIPDRDFGDVPLLRPLLGMTRADIEAFAQEHGLSWREDRTNSENEYKRNKIRNLVFPVFREINPSFIQVLNRDIERIAEELSQGSSEAQVSKPMATLGRIRGRGPLPAGQWEGRRGEAPEGFDTCASEEPEFTVTTEPWDGTQPVKQPAGMLIMDADKLEPEVLENLTVNGAGSFSAWEQGDWIRPLGAPGRKKMQDWFTDHHIPADEKPFVPLLKSVSDPHHVLAVVGYCIDNSIKVSAITRRIIKVTVECK